MATIEVTLETTFTTSPAIKIVNITSSSGATVGNPVTLEPNDVLRIIWATNTDFNPTGVVVGSPSSGTADFSNTTGTTITTRDSNGASPWDVGSYHDYTVKASPTGGAGTIILNCNAAGSNGPDKTLYYSVSVADKTPQAYTYTTTNDQDPNTTFVYKLSDALTNTNANADVANVTSNTGWQAVSSPGAPPTSGYSTTSSTNAVAPGQYVWLRAAVSAAGDYGDTVVFSVDLGEPGNYETWSWTINYDDVNAFDLGAPVTNAALNSTHERNITVGGLVNASTAPITVTNCEYKIGAGGTYTTSAGNVSNGQVVYVRVTASGSYGTQVTGTLNIGGQSDTFSVTTEAADTVPADFDLGNNLIEAVKSQSYISSQITVSGMSTGVTVSADVDRTAGTGTVEFKRTGDTVWRDTAYVYSDVDNGDEFSVRITTPNADNATTTARLDIGTVNDTWSVTTQDAAVPSGSVEIPSGLTLPISQRDMMDFFGGDDSTYIIRADNLTAYNRGGSYVPDITTNTTCGWDSTGINTSTPIELRSFVGSATTFFMSDNPTNLSDVEVAYSGGGPWVLAVQWDVGDPSSPANEWAVGYGPGMWSKAEYKYAVTNLTAEGTGTSTGDITITSGSSPYTDYDPGNTFIRFEVSSSNANTQKLYSGTVTFYARHVDFPGTTEVSATANFSLNYLSNE